MFGARRTLHALPVGALDDREHGPLVDVGLGQDQLVGLGGVEDLRAGRRSTAPSTGMSGGDPASETAPRIS